MKYKNRDGDIITATKIDDNHYKITSSFEGNIRTGFDKNPKDTIFIDFSGGPMVNVGDNLGNWFNELKGLIVKSIKFDKGVVIETFADFHKEKTGILPSEEDIYLK